MAKYKTKHMPVDDQPYIVYGSTPNNLPDMVTSFAITPSRTVAQGANYTFSPTSMKGVGNYDSSIVWSLAVEEGGTIAEGTSLTQDGKLTVAATQATTKKLYVTATSSSGLDSTCTVTVSSGQ